MGRFLCFKEEVECGESIVVNLFVKKWELKFELGDEFKFCVESCSDGLYWIMLKVDKDSGEIINNEMWLCLFFEVVGFGSDGVECYFVLCWCLLCGYEDIIRVIFCVDIGECDGWCLFKVGGVNVIIKSIFWVILVDWLQ